MGNVVSYVEFNIWGCQQRQKGYQRRDIQGDYHNGQKRRGRERWLRGQRREFAKLRYDVHIGSNPILSVGGAEEAQKEERSSCKRRVKSSSLLFGISDRADLNHHYITPNYMRYQLRDDPETRKAGLEPTRSTLKAEILNQLNYFLRETYIYIGDLCKEETEEM